MTRFIILILLALAGVAGGDVIGECPTVTKQKSDKFWQTIKHEQHMAEVEAILYLKARIDSLEKRVAELEKNQIVWPKYNPNWTPDTTKWYLVPGLGTWLLKAEFVPRGSLKSWGADSIVPKKEKAK